MPTTDQLPASLHDLTYLHACTIDAGRDFHEHVGHLLATLDALNRRDSQEDKHPPTTR